MFNSPHRPLGVRRSVYHRAMREAGTAWRNGKPGTAQDVLVKAGLGDLWPTYLRTARTWTRAQMEAGDRAAANARITGRAASAPRKRR